MSKNNGESNQIGYYNQTYTKAHPMYSTQIEHCLLGSTIFHVITPYSGMYLKAGESTNRDK